MYDGVQTHGIVHELRMKDVFWGRQRILLRILDVLVAALPPPASQNRADLLTQSWRELVETIYPNNHAAREERMEYLAALLKRQTPLEVTPLD